MKDQGGFFRLRSYYLEWLFHTVGSNVKRRPALFFRTRKSPFVRLMPEIDDGLLLETEEGEYREDLLPVKSYLSLHKIITGREMFNN